MIINVENTFKALHCQVYEKHFRKKNENQGTYAKNIHFLKVPIQRYQDFRHILLNPKFPRNTMGFNNYNLSHKILKHRALTKVWMMMYKH